MSTIQKRDTSRSDKIVINLWRNHDGKVYAKSVDALELESRVRFSFYNDPPLEKVFSSSMAKEIKNILNLSAERRGVLMLPDLVIDAGVFFVRGCRVMTTASTSGIESIMIRLIDFSGSVISMLSSSFSKSEQICSDFSEATIYAFENVLFPLRKFGSYLGNLLQDQDKYLNKEQVKFLKGIAEEIDGLVNFGELAAQASPITGSATARPADRFGLIANALLSSPDFGKGGRPDSRPADQLDRFRREIE